ncbi:DUF1697 domain-containing protein [Telluria mixta]|uniref:DUF1697 domain-containing protein n=1 Tax=Telluria mixta TaxID=34071 RepID=A0ABT2BS65_9BURK|nr:DUF1697 domain-containing protein [Telluria mixta]MCS0627955.1 DUF1697 domain-containing protein [Telluria mixta]WEM93926.1 DUF1697 domain-containing protein [Telluria mixta]
MKFAAFFRNLNLGRPPAPTRTVLEAAFTEAGAVDPCSFLTNGTVVFEAGSPAKAARILKAAQATLRRDGFDEPAALRDVAGLAALVASDPLAGVEMDEVYAPCATFLIGTPADGVSLPSTNARGDMRVGDVRVVSWHDGILLSLTYKLGTSAGSPNAFVERTLDVPATTRVWNTVVRLVRKHAATPDP